MKILHVSSAKTFGGGEKHLVDLCRGLSKQGHEVYLALRPTNEWQERFDFIPPERILHVTLRNSFGMFSAKRVSRFIRQNNIQLIHAHLARDYVPASIAAKLAGDIPFVLTRHVLFKMKAYYKFALRNLSRAIAVSSAVEEALKEVFPRDKVVRISNGIDVHDRSTLVRQEASAEFRADYGLPLEAPLVGIVGQLSQLKGQHDFLLAAQQISEQLPEAHFIVVGKDDTIGASKRRELRRLAEVLGIGDKVLFLEWVDRTGPLYASLDVLVSASQTESFGLAMLEAMAGGTAIVATRTEGAQELIEDGESGLLVPIADPVAISEAVLRVLRDSGLKLQIAEAAKTRALREFSADDMIAKTISLYREIVL